MKNYLRIIIFLILGLLNGNPIVAEAQFADIGVIIFLADSNGKDAVFINEGDHRIPVFHCKQQNDMILTPVIDADRTHICFIVENGAEQRELHSLKLNRAGSGRWSADDTLITAVNNGAWPNRTSDGAIFLSMKDPESDEQTMQTDIYQYQAGAFSRISSNTGQDKHLWALLSPDATRLHYRKISMGSSDLTGGSLISSIIYDLESNTKTSHLVDRPVFVEQWASNNSLLISYKTGDDVGSRVYLIYDIITGQSTEIARFSSWQARLSPDAKLLATLQLVPEGGANFDIFITNLETGKSMNLTQTPDASESLVGWLN